MPHESNAGSQGNELPGTDIGSKPIDAPISGNSDTLLTPNNETQSGGEGDTQPGGDTQSGGEGDTQPGGEKEGRSDKSSDDEKKSSEKEQGAPEEYEAFTLPENVELDETALAEATPVFQELGLNQEQAQKLIDLDIKRQEREAQDDENAHNEQLAKWEQEAKDDPLIGKDFDANVARAAGVINAFGSENFKVLLNATGLGNHPEVIKFCLNAANHIGDDVIESATTKGSTTEPKSIAERMFPNQA